MSSSTTTLNDIHAKYKEMYMTLPEEGKEAEHKKKYDEFYTEYLPIVTDILFKDPESISIIKLFEAEMTKDVGFLFNGMLRASVDTFHVDIAKFANDFIGISKNVSLTLSYGFADIFRQMIPQDEEYKESVFIKHEKNIILAFQPIISSEGFVKKSNTFQINKNANDSQHYKKRITDMLSTVFNTDEIAIHKFDNALGFEFEIDGHDTLLIWLNSDMRIPVLLLYYKYIMDKCINRYLICSVKADWCMKEYQRYSFFQTYFTYMMIDYAGKHTTILDRNIGLFKNLGYRLKKVNQTGLSNLWNTTIGINRKSAKNNTFWNKFKGTRRRKRKLRR
jgi:hypothetical protein